MADWPYNTAAWRRLRLAKLMVRPLCEPCELVGRLVAANTVDHVSSIASGGEPFPGLDGLMSMCASCHGVKTRAVDQSGGKGIRFKGARADGLPVDRAHPFWSGYTPSEDDAAPAQDRCQTSEFS